jgi:hypothetical protein
VGKREDAEQELGPGEPVDEDRRSEVLEPGAARRERVADEVGPELARLEEPDDRPRPDRRRGLLALSRLGYPPPALWSAA